jgi:putative transposase
MVEGMSRAIVTRAHRLRLQVNDTEATRLEDLARARQKAWNWALATLKDLWGLDRCADRLRALDQQGQPYRAVDKFTLITLFTQNKESLDWTVDVPVRVFEYAFEDLMAAISAFLDNREPGGRKVGFPQFIPAREANSFTVRDSISLNPDQKGHKGTINLPRLAPLRVCGSTRHLLGQMAGLEGQIKEVTVSRVSGKWYASVLLERLAQRDLLDTSALGPSDSVGLDLGLTTYATFSDGHEIPNPRFATSHKRRERHRARGVGRKQSLRDLAFHQTGVMPPKSQHQLNSERDLTRYHARNRNRRTTFAAQNAAAVLPHYRVLGCETLAISNLVRNHCLARAISDAGWAGSVRALESRAEDQGCLVVKADRFYASSQLCSNCGYQNQALKGFKALEIRAWTCPVCGTYQLRDPNAALNLKPTPAQITLAYQAALEKISKYEKSKRKRAERAAKAAKTRTANTAARQERAERRQAAKIAQASTPQLPSRPTHLLPLMPVLGPAKTSVDQIPGETLNRSWRAGKSGSASAARNRLGSALATEARTAILTEGLQRAPAPPVDSFVHK